MPVVSEFAGNSLLCHLIGPNAFSARVILHVFAFLIGQCALRNEFFTWVKSIRKTQYLYNNVVYHTILLQS